MSFLSDQQPGSPFSDYSEVCKEPSLSPTVPAQSWDWQHTPSMDISTPRSLMVGSGAMGTTALTDEDKLCFFEQPGRGNGELNLPGKVGVIPGSPSVGNASLGSVGESPVSPLSSSLSPSLASPGRLPSALACGSTNRASLEQPQTMGASLIDGSLANVDPASQAWNDPSFGECSPMVAMPQVSLNYCVTGVKRENHAAKSDEEVTEGEAAVKTGNYSVGFPRADFEEEESDSEPCFLVHAQQQRKTMRRAVSECSHLSVPTTLQLPDRYPGEEDLGLNHSITPISRPCYSPNSMKRSLTVGEDQPPAPPSSVSAGTTQIDLWQDLPESPLCIPPFSSLNDDKAASTPSPLNDQIEDSKAEKELSGIVHRVPHSPEGVGSFDISSPPSADTDSEEENNIHSEFAAFHHADARLHTDCPGVALNLEGVTKSRVGGDSDDDLTTSSFNNKGLSSCSNSFITMDGRWSLIFEFNCYYKISI